VTPFTSDRLSEIFVLHIGDRSTDRSNVSVIMSGMHLREFVRQAQAMLDGEGPPYASIGRVEARVFALANGGIELRAQTQIPDAW
jgi:hypothetical protein